ncbi:MAG: cyclic nucleotide-binding domain-containing protein [Spirochaetaceae bacterium]|nr:cyclic nucleotide-binding domain-containing protein [Spirochaetaceae bacterium]
MGNPLQLGLVNYNKGAYITIEGKRADLFYIIRSGRVRIEKDMEIPEEDDESVLKPGDFFGVVSTMSNHSHIDNAVALDDCTLITVRSDQYSLLIERNTAVAMKIINGFSRQVRLLDKALTLLTFKSSVEVDERHLFHVGEYYAKQSKFSQAFYAYYKYCITNPQGSNVAIAKERMARIKPYAKTANLNPDTTKFIRQYPKDTMLFAEGESGPELFIIQKGSIRITKIVNNNEVLLALLKSGDIFGEMALLENKPRSASAIAHEDSILMAVNRANFKGMVVEQPRIISRLTSSLAERIWNLNRQLRNTLIEDPVGRLYDSLLLELDKERLDTSSRQSHTFGFGPNDLVNMVGLAKDAGRAAIATLLESKDLNVVDNKLYSSDISQIKKSAEYYKKMEIRRESRRERAR